MISDEEDLKGLLNDLKLTGFKASLDYDNLNNITKEVKKKFNVEIKVHETHPPIWEEDGWGYFVSDNNPDIDDIVSQDPRIFKTPHIALTNGVLEGLSWIRFKLKHILPKNGV